MFKEHPKGLYILFFTEMWERFSYYGMRAILVLYLVAQTKEGPLGGLGWSKTDALALYGTYTMLVYLLSIPGGIVADKLLGQKKTVLVGGILLVAGHSILAFEALWAFYTGLVLIILGVGALKPNISTMVGGLYKKGDIRRDKGFTIFYIGINVGAFLSSIIVGYVGETIGWHYGFGLAGIGMALGMIVYLYGQKYLRNVGELIKKEPVPGQVKQIVLFSKMMKQPIAFVPASLILILGLYLLFSGDLLSGILISIGGIALGFGIVIYNDLDRIEKDRVKVLLISFLIIIVFWGAYEQAGGLMNLFTKNKIDRTILGFTIPASVFQSVNPFIIMIFGTAVANFWAKRRIKGKEESAIFKMAIGTMIMGSGFLLMSAATIQFNATGSAGLYWLIGAYFLHTIGELSSSPVALSFITKLAPVQYASLMMGLYFAATGLGNKLAGSLGEAAQSLGELRVFTGIAAFTILFGLLLWAFLKKLKALTHGAEDIQTPEEALAPDELEVPGVAE